MRLAERSAEKQSIQKIEAYKKEEKRVFRKIAEARREMENGPAVDYQPYETNLLDLILALKGDLLDIEMALHQALDSASGSFFNTVKAINEEMSNHQSELSANLGNEF